MTEINEGTRLRVWPGSRPGNNYQAVALGRPYRDDNLRLTGCVVRVRYLAGPKAGESDFIADVHVEVDERPTDLMANLKESLRPSLPEARAARDEAVAQVEGNADPAWLEVAYEAVKKVAEAQPDGFIGDDVWTYLAFNHPLIPTPHEPRAMGAVMKRAVKDGVCHLKTCTACGTTKVMTTGRSRASHAGDVPVYVAGQSPDKDSLVAAAAAQRAYEQSQDGRRRAIQLAKAEGKTYRQIAEAMGLSVGNVHNLVKQ